ncbi:cytochrome c [Haloferula helveola]|uniref:Cytochrome c n=1 Tax=Haloferula helveola TaxID=490095 RepID=A0ABN6H8I7_9BACT|nr:cytochrome c [Haloferula helveola]
MRSLIPFIATALNAAEFPEPTNTETRPGTPMPAQEVAAKTPMPEGFRIGVFAAEPTVQNPIDCSWDFEGRMWVAENFTYERRGTNLRDDFRDRVILLKDTSGDGKADQRRVFTDDLINLTSLEWTPEGLWVMCPPQLLFIPDKNRDAVPDGPSEVVLDGFTVPKNNHHNFANGLRIGPDGWLYGRCGGSAPGDVGKPGTPAAGRIPLRGGVWRYHRFRGTFEVIASGTTNPWGHDWDKDGNLFIINTVNDHLFHVVPGMRLARKMTRPAHPRVYEMISGHADHWHYDTKGEWHQSRDGAANDLGGGHAHVGMMIYHGNNWPEEYRGRLFTINLHGRRINQEILKPEGSGFVASHAEDLFVTPDPFFRGVELTEGPHGEVYLLDWSDTGECHEHTGVHRTSGRIYMITYDEYRKFDVLTLEERNDDENSGDIQPWFLRIYQTIAPMPRIEPKLADAGPDAVSRSLRFTTDFWPLDRIDCTRTDLPNTVEEAEKYLPHMARLADHSPRVRLELASILQRLPVRLRRNLAVPLVRHAEDADDHNLPLLVWYGLIPVADHHPDHLVEIFAACEWPKLRQFIARRLAEDLDTRPAPLDALLRTARAHSRPGASADIVIGMSQALSGWATAEAPRSWKTFTETVPPASKAQLDELHSLFGDGRSIAEIEAVARNPKAPLEARHAAVRGLIRANPDNLKPILLSLLDTRQLNTTAASGLASFDDPKVAEALIRKLGKFHSTEQDKILEILSARPVFAKALLATVESGKLPAKQLTAYHARQIENLGDPVLTEKLHKLWGTPSSTDAAKADLIEKTRAALTPNVLAEASLKSGKQQFEARCASCHKLHGKGGNIGPDLTGGGRSDLDYLLHNIIDPSFELAPDYRMEIFTLKDGRTLTGVVKESSPKTVVIQTMTDRVPLERGQIGKRLVIETSLMPEGLLNGLSPEQVRDLFGYLMHPGPPAE